MMTLMINQINKLVMALIFLFKIPVPVATPMTKCRKHWLNSRLSETTEQGAANKLSVRLCLDNGHVSVLLFPKAAQSSVCSGFYICPDSVSSLSTAALDGRGNDITPGAGLW